MKSWTLDQMLAEDPCYTEYRIKRLFSGRTKVSLLDILDTNIPAEDKMWCVLRGALSGKVLTSLARKASERANDYADTQVAKKGAGPWAEDWLSGKDRSVARAYKEIDGINKPAVISAYYAAAAKSSIAYDNGLSLYLSAMCLPHPKKEYAQQVEDLKRILEKQMLKKQALEK